MRAPSAKCVWVFHIVDCLRIQITIKSILGGYIINAPSVNPYQDYIIRYTVPGGGANGSGSDVIRDFTLGRGNMGKT